jgi:hypothetical protein
MLLYGIDATSGSGYQPRGVIVPRTTQTTRTLRKIHAADDTDNTDAT